MHLIAIQCLVALLAVGQSGGGNVARRAQYRGPVDQLISPVPMPGPGGGPPVPGGPTSPLLNPVGFMEGYNRWEFWFEINKDLLLRSRDFRRREVITPRSTEAGSPLDDGRIRPEDVRSLIAPALRTALSSPDERVATLAAVGLGRAGGRESLRELEELATVGPLIMRRAATFALGLVDDRAALSRLVNLLGDDKSPPEVRSMAALAIGLQGRKEGSRFLVEYLTRSFTSETVLGPDSEIFVAGIAAIGMCRDRSAAPLMIARYRAFREERRGRTRPVEALLLTALGRIGDPSGLPTLLEALEEKDLDIRRAAALALGDLGDRAAVNALVEILDKDNDDQSRGFAAIALGRLGGETARDALRRGFAVKGSRTVKSFSALGLGLLGDRGSSAELLKLLNQRSEDDLRGSAAIALGLLEEPRAVEPLLKIVENRGSNADFRGYCAIALGMIRAEGVFDRLVKMLHDDPDKVDLWRRALCLGVGLFHDARAGEPLVKVLVDDSRDIVREHAALALNLCRGRGAIEPLVKRLQAEPRGDVALFCVAALSGLGDRHEYPLVSEAFFNVNYRLRSELLEELEQAL